MDHAATLISEDKFFLQHLHVHSLQRLCIFCLSFHLSNVAIITTDIMLEYNVYIPVLHLLH